MQILGLIPARGGSKGIEKKNIKLLGGKPLIQYTIESANESKLLSKTIVSTDDDIIVTIVQSLGGDAPFLRPSALATDESPTIETVIHALQWFEQTGEYYDAVCLLQPTTPFRESGFIDKALSHFINSKVDSLISVISVPDKYNPHWVFEEDDNGFLHLSTGEQNIISRRQDLPKTFIRDGSIYITKSDVILKNKSLYGKTISYICSNQNIAINIDTKEDWQKATILIKAYNKIK